MGPCDQFQPILVIVLLRLILPENEPRAPRTHVVPNQFIVCQLFKKAHLDRTTASRTSALSAEFPKSYSTLWFGPEWLYQGTGLHAARKFPPRLGPLKAGSRKNLSNISKHSYCQTSFGIHRKIRKLALFIYFRGFPLESWFDPCIWPWSKSAARPFQRCSSRGQHSRPKRDNLYREFSLQFWTIPSGKILKFTIKSWNYPWISPQTVTGALTG